MKDHINVASPIIHMLPHGHHRHSHCRSPISPWIICLLVTLLLVGLCVSTFILSYSQCRLLHAPPLHLNSRRHFPVLEFPKWRESCYLHYFQDSDHTTATHGQLVKITVVWNKRGILWKTALFSDRVSRVLMVGCKNAFLCAFEAAMNWF